MAIVIVLQRFVCDAFRYSGWMRHARTFRFFDSSTICWCRPLPSLPRGPVRNLRRRLSLSQGQAGTVESAWGSSKLVTTSSSCMFHNSRPSNCVCAKGSKRQLTTLDCPPQGYYRCLLIWFSWRCQRTRMPGLYPCFARRFQVADSLLARVEMADPSSL